MSTAQTIITNGYAKSSAARVDTIAVPNELLARIGQCLREMFQIIVREDPYLIGTSAQSNFDGAGWPRPADALRVLDVYADAGTIIAPAVAVGSVINVVPYDDRLFCEGLPSVTELGQKFIPAGQTMDPSGGSVLQVYARGPIIPTLVSDDIDPLFPAVFDDLLQFDIAAYLATKDQRAEDEQSFLGFKNALVQQLIEWTHAPTYSLVQRFPVVTPPLMNAAGGRQQPAKE